MNRQSRIGAPYSVLAAMADGADYSSEEWEAIKELLFLWTPKKRPTWKPG
jgi:hypothetical protein